MYPVGASKEDKTNTLLNNERASCFHRKDDQLN